MGVLQFFFPVVVVFSAKRGQGKVTHRYISMICIDDDTVSCFSHEQSTKKELASALLLLDVLDFCVFDHLNCTKASETL